MAVNVSATGAWATIGGVTVTQFADDSQPFSVTNTSTAHTQFDVNGDFVKTRKWGPIEIAISVIGGSEDDYKLWMLLQDTKPGSSKSPAEVKELFNEATLFTGVKKITLKDGMMIDGPDSLNVSQEGRITASTYTFQFKTPKYEKGSDTTDLSLATSEAIDAIDGWSNIGEKPQEYNAEKARTDIESRVHGDLFYTEGQQSAFEKSQNTAEEQMDTLAIQNPGKQPPPYTIDYSLYGGTATA